jgi:hypothetical protein
MYPLNEEVFKDLKQQVSIEEITSATYDAMYGHDFKLPIITELGSYFLKSLNVSEPYLIDDSIPHSKIEDVCISQTLQSNNYSTINQDGDNFSICFNSNINYLVVGKSEMFYRESEIPWNITFSPLISQPIYASVDFVSGEPSISVLLSQQVNFIKQRNINQKEILPFSLLDEGASDVKIKDVINEINDNTTYNEFYTVLTLFDGAAPYGGKPFYVLDAYDSSIQFGNNKENALKISTSTTEETDVLQKKWLDDRVKTINTDFLEKLSDLSDNQKTILANKDFEPSYKFNQIWGTILNSTNTKLKKKITESIYSKFNQLVGEIKNKVSLLNQPPQLGRSSRSGLQQNNGHFKDYQQFNNQQIENMINEIIEYTLSSEDENFYAMMSKYILLIEDANNNADKVNDALILLNILEVTVKTLFTEDITGVFISLDYKNISDIGQQDQEIINREMNKFQKEIQKTDYKRIMRDVFNTEMKKKYPAGIFKSEKYSSPMTNIVERRIQSAQAGVSYTDVTKTTSPILPLSLSPESGRIEKSVPTIGGPFAGEIIPTSPEMSIARTPSNESEEGIQTSQTNTQPLTQTLTQATEIDTQRDSQYPSTPSPEYSPTKYAKTSNFSEGKSPRGGKTLKLHIKNSKNHRKSIKKSIRNTKNHTLKHMKNTSKQIHNKTP